MKELREIIGENLTELRKQNKLTQLELAEKLNYSDKAISKWENGSALPPVDILLNLANLYGVTLDYITKEGNDSKKKNFKSDVKKDRQHFVITLLSVSLVWIVATLIYVILILTLPESFIKLLWIIFCWALPTSCIVLIVFNAIWGKRNYFVVIESILVWSLLACIYLQIGIVAFWPVFIIGVPLQVSVLLWHKLK